MAFILILCHCIVVLLELCIDNNQIQIFFFFFLPATRVSFDGMPVRETYIQIGMALCGARSGSPQDLSPDLWIGVMEWHFHSFGIMCLVRLTEKRW